MDRRISCFGICREIFHRLTIDGILDVEKLERRGWKVGTRMGEEEKAEGEGGAGTGGKRAEIDDKESRYTRGADVKKRLKGKRRCMMMRLMQM